MSLEDKFNPDYGTIVDKVDNALVKVHSKLVIIGRRRLIVVKTN